MQNTAAPWPQYTPNYYNPITKIRSLIRNLDAELMQLCHRSVNPLSTITKPHNSLNNLPGKDGFNGAHSANSMISTSNDPNNGVHIRTLSSIYRAKVIDAYRNRRIFTVYGNYHTVRRALLRRGWLEKLAPGRYPKLHVLPEETLLQHAKRGNDYEAVVISKIINHFPAFFIWQPKAQRDLCGDVLPHRNRVRRGRNLDFSTKVGLIGCAEQELWYRQDGVCGMSYPRFYRLGGSLEERMAFIDDYRQTQCRCLLRYVVENYQAAQPISDDLEGTIDIAVLKFAIAHLRRHISDWEHKALDDARISNADSETVEWQNFMLESNKVIHGTEQFKATAKEMTEHANTSTVMLRKLEEKRPDYRWDGCRNLWILKPGYQSRGIGIIIRSSMDDILQWCNSNTVRRYIAQKYIERPMLVYKTKFDMRQYMLLSIGESTVSVWMYKDCYLRFSSQEFTIDDLRESIHLTNNSVQKRYKNKNSRDARLPRSNMWSSEQFKAYLRQEGIPENTWETVIYDGFKENLIAVVMASLEETEFIENSFELYGCDFMLDEQFHPILIEINSTPDLSPSTDVTARICPMVLKDLVKVIVDLPRNTRAPTGLFELCYTVNYKYKNDLENLSTLELSGKKMTLFKPLRTYRHKYYKPPNKNAKKQETVRSAGRKSNAKSSPRTGSDVASGKVKIQKCSAVSHHLQLCPHDKSKTDEKGNSFCSPPLKTSTKEALALRYTVPK